MSERHQALVLVNGTTAALLDRTSVQVLRGERFHPLGRGATPGALGRSSPPPPPSFRPGGSMRGTGAVVAKIKSNPTHTSLGAGSIGAPLPPLQSPDWVAGSGAPARFLPP